MIGLIPRLLLYMHGDSLPSTKGAGVAKIFLFCLPSSTYRREGGAVSQSVERATPGEEVEGSIPAVGARSLLVGLVSV